MVEARMSELFGAIFELLFEVVAFFVGLVVVELLSLGHVKCLSEDIKVKKCERRLWGLYVRRRNKIYLPTDVVALIGLLSIVLTVGGGWGIYWVVHH
jgi:hypothetical protein